MFELLHSRPETFISFQVLTNSKSKVSNTNPSGVDLRPGTRKCSVPVVRLYWLQGGGR
jgi:hypothetical protein